MDFNKLLPLLIVFVIYTNYLNYFKEDITKLHKKESNLKARIQREIQINNKNYVKEDLKLNYAKMVFDGKKLSYSKAMGKMQNQINEAAKGNCSIDMLKWAQASTTKTWYDVLRMNVSATCTPKELFILTNNLKNRGTLFIVENFRITRLHKIKKLKINVQIIGFRIHS